MRRHLIFLAILVTLLPVAATAAIMVRMPLDDLTGNADVVALATVERAESFLDEDEGRIYTRHFLKTSEYLKGAGRETVEVVTLGGELEDIGQVVPGEARFEKGEEVLVCLMKSRRGYAVVGMSQGKFRVEKREGKSWLVRSLRGVHFVGDGASVKDSNELPLEAFRALIKSQSR
jgi:hypothetical protein